MQVKCFAFLFFMWYNRLVLVEDGKFEKAILSIDYGDARIGLALSRSRVLASPLYTIKASSMRKDIDRLAAIAKKENAGLIVLGLPLMLDGVEGDRANKTRALGRALERVAGVRLEYEDERFSTIKADEQLADNNMRKTDRMEVIDTASAVVILQSYLDAHPHKL